MKKIIAGLCIASSLVFAQSEAKLNINDKTLEVGVDVFLNYFYELDNNSKYYLGANYIKSENDNRNNSLIGVNFKVLSPLSSHNALELGMGLKTVLINNDSSEDFVSVPLGVHAIYNINRELSVDTSVYYGPKVLSFADAKRYLAYDVNVNYKVLPSGLVYLGARKIDTEYEDIKDKDFNKSVYAGFKFLF